MNIVSILMMVFIYSNISCCFLLVLLNKLNKMDRKEFVAEKVGNFDGGDETETKKKSQDSSDSANKWDNSNFFFGDIFRNVGVLDVHIYFDQILSRVKENFVK